MSYRATYEVIDAWQRVYKLRAGGAEWGLLTWLCRQADQSTMTVVRSQDRLGEELGISGRQVREYIKRWRMRGVLKVVEHGGGMGRKPAKYVIDLAALKVFALRCSEMPEVTSTTPEEQDFRRVEPSEPPGSLRTSGVPVATPEVHRVPELKNGADTSGVAPQLRKSGDATPEVWNTNSGSLRTSASSESSEYSEKKSSEEAQPCAPPAPRPSSPARQASRRASSALTSTKEPQPAIDQRIDWALKRSPTSSDREICTMVRGATLEAVRRRRRSVA